MEGKIFDGRHIIKATLSDGRETLVRGANRSLTVLDDIITKNKSNIIFVYAWRKDKDAGLTRRYRWLPRIGWQMLDTKKHCWK